MSDDETEEPEPAVELGEADPVAGAPIARVASRLTFPLGKSIVIEREGEAEIRTPDGPTTVAAALEEVEETYFADRQAFVDAVEGVVGTGPVASE